MKTKTAEEIVKWLAENGVAARVCGSFVGVNRDSMCNSKFAGEGIPEATTYPNVIYAIEERFPCPHGMMWAGKTDDDLFLDVLSQWER